MPRECVAQCHHVNMHSPWQLRQTSPLELGLGWPGMAASADWSDSHGALSAAASASTAGAAWNLDSFDAWHELGCAHLDVLPPSKRAAAAGGMDSPDCKSRRLLVHHDQAPKAGAAAVQSGLECTPRHAATVDCSNSSTSAHCGSQHTRMQRLRNFGSLFFGDCFANFLPSHRALCLLHGHHGDQSLHVLVFPHLFLHPRLEHVFYAAAGLSQSGSFSHLCPRCRSWT
mmetsp:Transcript_84686/g.203006  ORF Transcript_84686/g.203006 Transcript_84686/m.203006 type:complete len:228 (-) Transcript_84686:104-787(-)